MSRRRRWYPREYFYYVVVRGRNPGIYHEWEGSKGAAIQVSYFPAAKYKGFRDLEKAKAWYAQNSHLVSDEVLPSTVAEAKEYINKQKSQGKSIITSLGIGKTLPNRGVWGFKDHSDKQMGPSQFGFTHLADDYQLNLIALIMALKSSEGDRQGLITTTSETVFMGINLQWVDQWEQNGWKTKYRRTPKYLKMWQLAHQLYLEKKPQVIYAPANKEIPGMGELIDYYQDLKKQLTAHLFTNDFEVWNTFKAKKKEESVS